MFNGLLAKLNEHETAYRNELLDTRRRMARYPAGDAEVVIGGQPHMLQDWSMECARFDAPEADVVMGRRMKMALRFHLMGETVEVETEGSVVRRADNDAAVKFTGLTESSRRKLARVRDLQQAQEFLRSQVHMPEQHAGLT